MAKGYVAKEVQPGNGDISIIEYGLRSSKMAALRDESITITMYHLDGQGEDITLPAGSTVQALINKGFTDLSRAGVLIYHRVPNKPQCLVAEEDFGTLQLRDGDEISVNIKDSKLG